MPIDDPASPVSITVADGLTLKGVLLDATTLQPIADTRIALAPAPNDFARVRYRGLIQGTTDSAGHFRFDNLESAQYRLLLPGATTLRVVGADGSSVDDDAMLEPGQGGWVMVKVARTSAGRGFDAEGR